jgi:hypothetical protein
MQTLPKVVSNIIEPAGGEDIAFFSVVVNVGSRTFF